MNKRCGAVRLPSKMLEAIEFIIEKHLECRCSSIADFVARERMTLRIQTVTLLPALCLFVLSSLFAFLTLKVGDASVKQRLLILTSSLFIGGLTLTLYWFYSWVLSKRFHESESVFISRVLSLSHLIGFFLLSFGSVTLVWVGQLTWHDITVWGKDIALIFFGSRTGENISLGIGARVIHLFLIGLTLLLLGFVVFLHKLRECPHHFGYLASYHKKAPIHAKCLTCPLVADCIMTAKRRPHK